MKMSFKAGGPLAFFGPTDEIGDPDAPEVEMVQVRLVRCQLGGP